MKSWSLQTKVMSIIVLLVATGAATSGVGIYELGRLDDQIEHIANYIFPRVIAVSELKTQAVELVLQERTAVLEMVMGDALAADKRLARVDTEKEKFDKQVEALMANATGEGRQILEEIKGALNKYWSASSQVKDLVKKGDKKAAFEMSTKVAAEARRALTKEIQDGVELNKKRLEAADHEASLVYTRARTLSVLLTALSAIGGMTIALLVMRGVMRVVRQVVDALSRASDEVAKASQQIASASEELSQSTSEQASSLQETSSSLEELTSMVAKNTESARQAADNAKESLASAESGKHTIHSMVGAIQELEKSNQQIAEIVKVFAEVQEKTKVIEDIVFQTQLLSFNASVEAARAGEHGKGFAVVAEEVGNLAEMSGNASTEIASLLQNSLKHVENTVTEIRSRIEKLVNEGSQGVRALETIVNGAHSSTTKATEIATASHEQSRGIEEINRAITQLDHATQQNAATSEEAASAAEELSSQAGSLKSTVEQLVGVIQGSTAVPK